MNTCSGLVDIEVIMLMVVFYHLVVIIVEIIAVILTVLMFRVKVEFIAVNYKYRFIIIRNMQFIMRCFISTSSSDDILMFNLKLMQFKQCVICITYLDLINMQFVNHIIFSIVLKMHHFTIKYKILIIFVQVMLYSEQLIVNSNFH